MNGQQPQTLIILWCTILCMVFCGLDAGWFDVWDILRLLLDDLYARSLLHLLANCCFSLRILGSPPLSSLSHLRSCRQWFTRFDCNTWRRNLNDWKIIGKGERKEKTSEGTGATQRCFYLKESLGLSERMDKAQEPKQILQISQEPTESRKRAVLHTFFFNNNWSSTVS